MEFYTRRKYLLLLSNIATLIIALILPKFGVIIFLISPVVEIWIYFHRGILFEDAEADPFSFEDYVRGRKEIRKRKSSDQN